METGATHQAAPGVTGTAEAMMAEVRAGTRHPQRRDDLTVTDLDDEMILYDPVDGSTHALNGTAALIWELCDGEQTLHTIIGEMVDAYSIKHELAQHDAESLLEQFYSLGLLQTA